MRFDGFTREDEQRFIDLTKDGVTAIFIYTDKLVVNGERTAYKKDRTVVFSGEIYAPVSLFTDFLGVSCTECDNGAVLEFSGKRAAVSYEKGGEYLPVEKTCAELGIYTRAFAENSFLLIGNKAVIDTVAADEVLAKAGPYALFGDYDVSGFTDEDYERVAKNFHDKFVGTEETNDMSNPLVQEKIRVII